MARAHTIHYKYNYNFNVLTNEDDISYYLLGAFITDGCVYKNNPTTYACQLSSSDEEWLNDIKNILGTNLKLHKFKNNYWGIRIIRHEIAIWFIDHGCHPRKTLTVKMPNVPDKYMPDFLRGCIDGDGSIGSYKSKTYIKRVCHLTSASLIFLEKIQQYLTELEITCYIRKRKLQPPRLVNNKLIIHKHDIYDLIVNSENCFKFLKLIYYKDHKLSLSRKKEKANEIISYFDNRLVSGKNNRGF